MFRTLVLSAVLALPAAAIPMNADAINLVQRDGGAVNGFVGVERDAIVTEQVEIVEFQQKPQSDVKAKASVKVVKVTSSKPKTTSSHKTSSSIKKTSSKATFPHAPLTSSKPVTTAHTSSIPGVKGQTTSHGTTPFSAPGVRHTSSSSSKGGKVFSSGKNGGFYGDNSLSSAASAEASASISGGNSSDDSGSDSGSDSDTSSSYSLDTTDVWTPVGSSEWLVPTKPFDPQPTAFTTTVSVKAGAHASAVVKAQAVNNNWALAADLDADSDAY